MVAAKKNDDAPEGFVDVVTVNNSGQTSSLRLPAGSELIDQLIKMARREELVSVKVGGKTVKTDADLDDGD